MLNGLLFATMLYSFEFFFYRLYTHKKNNKNSIELVIHLQFLWKAFIVMDHAKCTRQSYLVSDASKCIHLSAMLFSVHKLEANFGTRHVISRSMRIPQFISI